MTDRKPLMQITIFNEPNLPCRVQSFEAAPVEQVSPMMLILGVAYAIEEFFADAVKAGEVKFRNDLN